MGNRPPVGSDRKLRDRLRARLDAASPEDWELATSLEDGAVAEPSHDLLLASVTTSPSSRAALYLARAADRTVVAMLAPRGEDAPGDANAAPVRTLATLEAPARGMALAAGALWVTFGHSVERIPIAGGAATVVGAGFVRPGALALGAGSLFVVDVDAAGGGLTHTSTVFVLPALGKGERKPLGHSDGDVTAIAVDDSNVYWADRLEGTIVSVPVGGGSQRVLAADRGLPGDLVADDSDLYWVEKRSESLWTMPKTGGLPRRLAQDFAGFANVAVYSGGVGWTNEAAALGAFQVLTVAKSGGEVRAVTPAVDAIDALATDGTHLFWDRGGVITRAEDPR
jgi:hypothetical protein